MLHGRNIKLGAEGRNNVWRLWDTVAGSFSANMRQIEITTSGAAEDLLIFTRSGAALSSNRQLLLGYVTLSVTSINNVPNYVTINRLYHLSARGETSNTINLVATLLNEDDNLGGTGATFSFATKAGASATSATLTGTFTLSNMVNAQLKMSFDLNCVRNINHEPFNVTIVAA